MDEDRQEFRSRGIPQQQQVVFSAENTNNFGYGDIVEYPLPLEQGGYSSQDASGEEQSQ